MTCKLRSLTLPARQLVTTDHCFPMLLGYNTNGLAHHDPLEAIKLLREIGYGSVALTLDHGLLNPANSLWRKQVDDVNYKLVTSGMRSVIETGARFLLDYRQKHEPTLVSPDSNGRKHRVAFLKHAIDVAAQLNSDCVSLWSGVVKDSCSEAAVWDRLIPGLREVLDHAATKNVVIGFEPEPGMFIDTMARYQELLDRLDAPQLRLTLDVGHLHCLGETPLADHIRCWASRIVNVHIEDMRAGVHEHLMFGEGEIDFPPVLQAFRDIGYAGGLHVELSRHSHVGPDAAKQAFDFLRALLDAHAA